MGFFIKNKHDIAFTLGVVPMHGIPALYDLPEDMGCEFGLFIPICNTGFIIPDILRGKYDKLGPYTTVGGYSGVMLGEDGSITVMFLNDGDAVKEPFVQKPRIIPIDVPKKMGRYVLSAIPEQDDILSALLIINPDIHTVVDRYCEMTTVKRHYVHAMSVEDIPALVKKAKES